MSIEKIKIAIVGGCGHVGLPLGVKLALAGADIKLIDIDAEKVKQINSGIFPFVEKNGDKQLKQALTKSLQATTEEKTCGEVDVVVFVTGTPVDEHLNPKLSEVLSIFDIYQPYLREDTLVIMRSTLFPGTMDHLHKRIAECPQRLRLAFCPERVSQGYALDEIDSLPQIISAYDDESFQSAYKVFSALAPSIIKLTPLEAEITKLMANSWRYLEFAIANQFYTIAEEKGLDFYRIFNAIRYDYPRAKGYKSPGFAAGPCLFKDTMQLASYVDHQFFLGHSAMLINENLAAVVTGKAQKAAGGSLWGKTVGLLGMTFKSDNDDTRESLSFKVKKGLEFKGANILFNDPYIAGSTDLKELEQKSDVLVLCTPHSEYKNCQFSKPVVDVWGVYNPSMPEILPGRCG